MLIEAAFCQFTWTWTGTRRHRKVYIPTKFYLLKNKCHVSNLKGPTVLRCEVCSRPTRVVLNPLIYIGVDLERKVGNN